MDQTSIHSILASYSPCTFSVSHTLRCGNGFSATSASLIGSTTTGDFLDISRSNARLGLFIDLQIARADLPMVSTTGSGSQIVLDISNQIDSSSSSLQTSQNSSFSKSNALCVFGKGA